LSHHLALCDAGEVSPYWALAPKPLDSKSLNLLVLPWPLEVLPSQFRENRGLLANMDDSFGFFTWDLSRYSALIGKVDALVREAERVVGRVDALVFPELALPTGDGSVLARHFQKIVIAGEGASSDQRTGEPGKNAAVVAVPYGDGLLCTEQEKHHRWKLDESQIEQYGLGGQLDPNRSWWEHIRLDERKIRFWCLNDWLTFCVLICEDLARQEPVSPLVRSVGPNLVIALVMDGPQLAFRWTSRYATVLADDPGSSVLAITNFGMVQLSRAAGKGTSTVVALWKDGSGGTPREVALEPGSEALVLCLTQKYVKEWTADGRHDNGATGCLLLRGVHQIRSRV
jgi:hypothetical protein